MLLADRILSRFGYEKRAADPSWAALASGMGAGGSAGTVSVRAAENLSAVLGCVSVISSSLASIPALVYQRDASGNRVEVPGHALAKLTRMGVSPNMTWPAFIEHVVASVLLTGNALAEVMRAPSGEISGLEFIPWSWVSVAQLSSGRLAYDVNNGQPARARRLLAGEVIHLRDRTDDGLIGRSRLSRAAETVQSVDLANRHSRAFLTNGASPSGVIEVPGKLTPDQANIMREQFSQRHSGAGNAGTALILDGGLSWKSVQISPEDAELLETRKFGTEEICRLFQVPPPLVQDYSHNTFTNSETAGRWFAMFTLQPWARKLETEFVRGLFGASGVELEFDLSGFLRGDPATRWNAHKIALETGVLTPDEVRQVEGWNARGVGS